MEAFVGGVLAMFIIFLLLFTVGNYAAKYLSTALGAPNYGGATPLASFLGIPSDTASWPNALWFIILPMMATLGILYGFFEELRIFRNATNATTIYTVIGIAWSGLLMYTGALKVLALFLYQIGALVAAIVFSVVFIFGAILWGFARGGQYKSEYGTPSFNLGLRGEKDLVKVNLEKCKKGLKRLKWLNKLSNPTKNENDEFNRLRSEFDNVYTQLSVQLTGALTKKQQEERDKLKAEFDKLKPFLINSV